MEECVKLKIISISKILFIIILLIFLQVNLFAKEVFWWTVVPSSEISDTGNYGFTLGQTSAGPVSGTSAFSEGNYGFWYNEMVPVICFTIDPNSWVIDSLDSLWVGEQQTMELGEEIKVSNCGNCHLGLGLYYSGDSLGWTCAYVPDRVNVFSLRARFDDTCPMFYNHIFDFVKAAPTITWATDNILGTRGYDLNIYGSENLWFQFVAPYWVTDYEIEDPEGGIYISHNRIDVTIMARANLP